MPTLADLSPNQLARICNLRVDSELGLRLVALGLRLGREVIVIRRGWLGGPLQVRIGTTEFMLRYDAARQIDVEILDN